MVWLFVFYVGTTVLPKCFTSTTLFGPTEVPQFAYMVYNTIGSVAVGLMIVFGFGWWRRFKSEGRTNICGLSIPREFLFFAPAGICTAIIIPGTTLMYSFGKSDKIDVLFAMVAMRGAVIAFGWIDENILKLQKISDKKIFWQEHMGVLIALAAVIAMGAFREHSGNSLFSDSGSTALTVFILYLAAYGLRIYIMNWYKYTRKGKMGDNKGYFAIEQFFAAGTLLIATPLILVFGSGDARVVEMSSAFSDFNMLAIMSGIPFGLVAFASVFLFMFKGRNGVFGALANRATSLMAGTVGNTLLWYPLLIQDSPKYDEFIGLGLVLCSVVFIGWAEYRYMRAESARKAEEAAQQLTSH